MSDDDDMPVLSDYARQALEEFLASQKQEEETDEVSEDWQLSQFWYDDKTSDILAKETLDHTENTDYIGFVSSPTAYKACKKMDTGDRKVFVFEFDKRFSKYGEDFVFFDFNDSSLIPENLKGKFAMIMADPPFLSKDCMEKTADCMDILLAPNGKILIATGAIQEEVIAERWKGKVVKTTWSPTHEGGRLQNPFGSWVNYDSKNLTKEK